MAQALARTERASLSWLVNWRQRLPLRGPFAASLPPPPPLPPQPVLPPDLKQASHLIIGIRRGHGCGVCLGRGEGACFWKKGATDG